MAEGKDLISDGQRLLAEERIEEAKQLFLSAIERGVKIKEVYKNLGIIEFQDEKIEMAIAYLMESLRIDPFYRDAVLCCFEVLKHSTRYHVILPTLRTFLDRFPEDEEVKEVFLQIKEHIAQKTGNERLLECEKDPRDIPLACVREVRKEQKIRIRKIKTVLKMTGYSENDIHKPHRNLVLTGIPGSGIRMFSGILV